MSTNAAVDELWLRRYHPSPGAAIRLVCLPHAGGSASFYFPLSRAMAPSVEVLAVQYPGRQDRRSETVVPDIGVLADRIAEALDGCLDGPFALFGHSMGALLAFEVATRLEADGAVPAVLFASGRRAPSRHRDENIHQRSDDGIVAELRQLSGTDSGLLGDEDVLRMILPAVRSDYQAIETYRYRPRPPLAGPVVALVGDSDPQVDLDEAHAWADHTTGGFALHTYSGGHFFLSEHQEEVIAAVRRHLPPG